MQWGKIDVNVPLKVVESFSALVKRYLWGQRCYLVPLALLLCSYTIVLECYQQGPVLCTVNLKNSVVLWDRFRACDGCCPACHHFAPPGSPQNSLCKSIECWVSMKRAKNTVFVVHVCFTLRVGSGFRPYFHTSASQCLVMRKCCSQAPCLSQWGQLELQALAAILD